MMNVRNVNDTVKLDIKSFGFDKQQVQFLEERVYNRHHSFVSALYNRMRYNVKTFGLNDNVDIDLDLQSVVEGSSFFVWETNKLSCGSAIIASLTTWYQPGNKQLILVEDEVVEEYDSRTFATKLNAVMSGSDVGNQFYGDVSDDGTIVNSVDVAFVKKFFSDFIIDMGQFNVTWRILPSENTLSVAMIYNNFDVLHLEIQSPNQKYRQYAQ